MRHLHILCGLTIVINGKLGCVKGHQFRLGTATHTIKADIIRFVIVEKSTAVAAIYNLKS